MIDFEYANYNAIKKILPDTIVLFCYFHFVKALWDKANKLGIKI
jgi:transposase-like protein